MPLYDYGPAHSLGSPLLDLFAVRYAVGYVDSPGDDRVRLRFRGPAGEALDPVEGAVVVACDGIHSTVRKQLYPDEGPPRWSGVNMWRGVVAHAPFLHVKPPCCPGVVATPQ